MHRMHPMPNLPPPPSYWPIGIASAAATNQPWQLPTFATAKTYRPLTLPWLFA